MIDSNQGIGILYRASATVAGEIDTPSPASLKPSLNGPSRPILRSAARRTAAPAAMAWPVQAITTGRSKVKIRRTRSTKLRRRFSRASAPDCSSLRSNPAENTPGRPVSMTAVAESSIDWSRRACTSAISAVPSALTLPSSNVIVAVPSARSYPLKIHTLLTHAPNFPHEMSPLALHEQRRGRPTDPTIAISRLCPRRVLTAPPYSALARLGINAAAVWCMNWPSDSNREWSSGTP